MNTGSLTIAWVSMSAANRARRRAQGLALSARLSDKIRADSEYFDAVAWAEFAANQFNAVGEVDGAAVAAIKAAHIQAERDAARL